MSKANMPRPRIHTLPDGRATAKPMHDAICPGCDLRRASSEYTRDGFVFEHCAGCRAKHPRWRKALVVPEVRS